MNNNSIQMSKDYKVGIMELELVNELLKIQGNDGNWNYDLYMLGMFNGMELIVATLEGREPKYRESPQSWACREIGKPVAENCLDKE